MIEYTEEDIACIGPKIIQKIFYMHTSLEYFHGLVDLLLPGGAQERDLS